ncbi:MAG TPA: chromate resistance protein ChrB domain-containing protein [Candidatus Eisenbacteria bacterium]|nr:chromate resistance protein ChrB domain-containing protein [Candidatus Eisenbacteria bacterium]
MEPPKDLDDWYLLIHQIPAKPLYLRARFLRLLNQSGAVALKQSVYALPRGGERLERLQAIAREIREQGGEAFVCETQFPSAADQQRVVDAFRRERDADYERLAAAARDAREPRQLTRLRRELARVTSVDFVGAGGRAAAEAAFEARERALARPAGTPKGRTQWTGRTWVTRRGVHVDRIACAWFIRRFLDPGARFRFVAGTSEALRAGEVGFDMPGAEFTHEGGRCSLETLIAKTGHRDAGLERIAGIVHDLDIKDGKFAFPEAAGIERLIAGIVAAHADDGARLERGAALLDDLHRSFAPRPALSAPKAVAALRPPRRGGKA